MLTGTALPRRPGSDFDEVAFAIGDDRFVISVAGEPRLGDDGDSGGFHVVDEAINRIAGA